jgi:hypothetical protein
MGCGRRRRQDGKTRVAAALNNAAGLLALAALYREASSTHEGASMSRMEFLKAEKWSVITLIVVTASLWPLSYVENPAGLPPVVLFGGIAAYGWLGIIALLLLPDSARPDVYSNPNKKDRP